MKKILILPLLFFINLYCNGQNLSGKSYSHQIGLNAGFTSGIGLSYRYWPKKFGIQVTFIGLKMDEDWTDILGVKNFAREFLSLQIDERIVSLGISGLYTVKSYNDYKLVTYLSNHYFLHENEEMYNIGAGFGVVIEKALNFSLMFGYGFYDILDEINYYPTAEVSLHYRIPQKNKNK